MERRGECNGANFCQISQIGEEFSLGVLASGEPEQLGISFFSFCFLLLLVLVLASFFSLHLYSMNSLFKIMPSCSLSLEVPKEGDAMANFDCQQY